MINLLTNQEFNIYNGNDEYLKVFVNIETNLCDVDNVLYIDEIQFVSAEIIDLGNRDYMIGVEALQEELFNELRYNNDVIEELKEQIYDSLMDLDYFSDLIFNV